MVAQRKSRSVHFFFTQIVVVKNSFSLKNIYICNVCIFCACPVPTRLQLVLDGRGPEQPKVPLDLVVDGVQPLLPVLQGDGGLVVRRLPVLELALAQVLRAHHQRAETLGRKFLSRLEKKKTLKKKTLVPRTRIIFNILKKEIKLSIFKTSILVPGRTQKKKPQGERGQSVGARIGQSKSFSPFSPSPLPQNFRRLISHIQTSIPKDFFLSPFRRVKPTIRQEKGARSIIFFSALFLPPSLSFSTTTQRWCRRHKGVRLKRRPNSRVIFFSYFPPLLLLPTT